MILDLRETTILSRPIVVCCPPFSENSGGAIVLHYLVDRLRTLGVEAYGWPIEHSYSRDMPAWLRALKMWNRRRKLRKSGINGIYGTHPSMDVPTAPREVLHHAIAVYPEIISGNPFGAHDVVRWLLNTKDFFNKAEHGEDELTFYYHPIFLKGSENVDQGNLLRIRWIREDIYFNHGRKERNGTCRMIRKGSQLGLGDVPENDTAILLDDMSHEEIADVFNYTEVFYCHDPRTMYLYYAALCGCIPVIEPQPGVSFADLRPQEDERWGIAYGEDGIEWARQTRNLLLERFKREQAAQEDMVRNFARTLATHFG